MATLSSLPSRSDEDLLSLLQTTGGHAAFTELVNRHASKFRALAYRFTNSTSDAEDIVQDAFVMLWQKPQSWDGSRNNKFTTWFYRIVVNRCLDHLRRKPMRPMPEDDVFRDTAALPDEALAERQQQTQLEQGFRALPVDMQTALNLSFYEAVPNQDGADIMGMSLKGFQSLVMRAKKTLRETIARQTTTSTERTRRYGT